jgi:hypothetical protein
MLFLPFVVPNAYQLFWTLINAGSGKSAVMTAVVANLFVGAPCVVESWIANSSTKDKKENIFAITDEQPNLDDLR